MASKMWPPAEHGADNMRALLHRAQEFEVDVGEIIADYEDDCEEDERELDVLEEMCYDLEARVDPMICLARLPITGVCLKCLKYGTLAERKEADSAWQHAKH